MEKHSATSYKLKAVSKKLRVMTTQFKAIDYKKLILNIKLNDSCLQLAANRLRLIVCSLLLVACCFSFSFAQESNRIIQQGNEAYKKNEYNAAIKDYSKALETDKKNTVAWFNMGNALQKTVNSDDASISYDEAI